MLDAWRKGIKKNGWLDIVVKLPERYHFNSLPVFFAQTEDAPHTISSASRYFSRIKAVPLVGARMFKG